MKVSLFLVPVLDRRHSVFFLEQAVEMLHVLVAHLLGDSFDALTGASDHGAGFFHTHAFYDLAKGLPGFVLDIFGQVGL